MQTNGNFQGFPTNSIYIAWVDPCFHVFFAAWEDMQVLMAYGKNKAKIKQVTQLTRESQLGKS